MYKFKIDLIVCIAIVVLIIKLMARSEYPCKYEYIKLTDIDGHLVKKTNRIIAEYLEECVFNIIDNVKPFKKRENITYVHHIDSGEYIPKCKVLYSTAIIIPMQNRKSQLNKFIPYIHEFLQNQRIHYRIFVVEQIGQKPFNRGTLFNVGANIAINLNFPCLILHDVDLMPQNQANFYVCTAMPRHMSASIDKFRYNLPYCGLVGGALSILSEQFVKINGFSNIFENWGGEDDDLFNRFKYENLSIIRFSPEISKYKMMPHMQAHKSEDRRKLLIQNKNRHKEDGLNTLKYQRIQILNETLYTNITVLL